MLCFNIIPDVIAHVRKIKTFCDIKHFCVFLFNFDFYGQSVYVGKWDLPTLSGIHFILSFYIIFKLLIIKQYG